MRHLKTMNGGALLAAVMAFAQPASADVTPGYNNEIPETILTPDTVETRIGTLQFFDGSPADETVALVYDNLDFMRGVQTFLNGMPASSIEGLRRGNVELGATESHHVVIFDDLMDSDPIFLTGNTDTVYALAFLDLNADGPTVVEIPEGSGPGTVNDAFFRFVIDMGAPGPDKGNGGKYLILPPEYDGPLQAPIGGLEQDVEVNGTTEKMFVTRSPSYVNWLILRGFLVDGKPDTASAMFRNGLKIYPLSEAGDPPDMQFFNGSEKPFNTIHANNFEFFHELDEVIQREPIGFLDPELRGLFASIGIEKGQEFDPDERMRKLLQDAVAVGNATARAIWIRSREEGTYYYEGSGWYTGFVGGSHEFLKNDGAGGRYLDARILFHYMATVITPAMVVPMVGAGSQYALINVDETGAYMDGAKTYKLNIPADVPAKDFWSVVAYDPQTRSQLQTDQPFPGRNNQRHDMDVNPDGSIDLYFGPEAPEGKDANWIQTVPGKGWFTALRLYGPLEPWFDRTWRPGEIQLVD
ncbi:MAG: DUF1254 domain-containing protein [Rhodobacteraceae bacterium]|jgi:hypothetical protein|nr:DUF1254 domain-containing protein [Paracoccaceae bacterium]